jgi:Tol biopolymer transport system component
VLIRFSIVFGAMLLIVSAFLGVLRTQPSEAYWVVFGVGNSDAHNWYMTDLAGKHVRQIPGRGQRYGLSWSPDGEWYAYATNDCVSIDYCSMDLNWVRLSDFKLQRTSNVSIWDMPIWSPDSNYLLYDGAGGVHEINIHTLEKKSITEVRRNSVYTPDGKGIVIDSSTYFDRAAKILTFIGDYAVYSPDSKLIVYAQGFYNDYKTNIHWVNLKANQELAIIELRGRLGVMKWSPNSHYLLITLEDSDSETGRYILIFDSSAQELILKTSIPSYAFGINWSPNNQAIFFNDGIKISKLEIQTATVREIAYIQAELFQIMSMSVSPDGNWIVYADQNILEDGYFGPYSDVYVMRSDGSERRLLTNNPKWQGYTFGATFYPFLVDNLCHAWVLSGLAIIALIGTTTFLWLKYRVNRL